MEAKSGSPETTDRIEKRIEVNAARARVWRAISNAEEFGAWFGMKLDRAFTPGAVVHGRLTLSGYEHITLEMLIERMDPERYFSYRWHPYPMNPAIDYTAEPTTLVEFRLEDAARGTVVTITESGFDQLPAGRRAEAFRMNEGGWVAQSKKLAAYVS